MDSARKEWDRSQGHPAFDAARDVVPLSSPWWVENANAEGGNPK
jgi:hypothetical protein